MADKTDTSRLFKSPVQTALSHLIVEGRLGVFSFDSWPVFSAPGQEKWMPGHVGFGQFVQRTLIHRTLVSVFLVGFRVA